MVHPRTALRTLHKLNEFGLITAEEKGKEILYDNPPNLVLIAMDEYIGLVADQIVTGDDLKEMVAALKDEELKAKITKAVNVAKLSASRST